MAQHDYSIANQSGSSFRADLNNALSAVVSQNSGSAEPTTMFAYQMWADTTAGVMKLRNGANSAWITLYELDGTFVTTDIQLGLGAAATPSLTFTGDLNTGVFSPGADQVSITTGGTERVRFDAVGQIEAVSLGTAAAPTYSFTTDPNTGIYSPGADQVSIATGGTQRVTVDASGRLGIGTASPAQALTVEGAGDTYAQVKRTVSGSESTFLVGAESGKTVIYSRDNTTGGRALQFSIGTTPAATIDASGRLGIGTASPTANLHVSGTGILVNGQTTATLNLNGSSYGMVSASSDLYLETAGAGNQVLFRTNSTERMKITSGGLLNVGTATAPSGSPGHDIRWQGASRLNLRNTDAAAGNCYGILADYTNAAPNGTTNEFLYCQDNAGGGTARAVIRSNGGLANYQANNVNLSDRNTKKDISLAADTWDCLKEWEIVNYRYKDQPDDADLNLGVIAQQVAESCPEVITVFQEAKEATEDKTAQEERLGVKEQQMYWMAIKALQEAQARIETLEAKVAVLEAK